jgi:hypothetical protein
MAKKTKAIIVSLVAIVGLTGLVATSFAYQGNPTVKGPNYSPERHEAMEQAFANRDYNAWKELMNGRGRVSQVINEENFARFAEAHELAENGDLEGAKKIREELGLGQGGRFHGAGKGYGRGMRRGMRGMNAGANFVDANNDGVCDNLQ